MKSVSLIAILLFLPSLYGQVHLSKPLMMA